MFSIEVQYTAWVCQPRLSLNVFFFANDSPGEFGDGQ